MAHCWSYCWKSRCGAWENFGNASHVPADPEKPLTLVNLPSVLGAIDDNGLLAMVKPSVTIGDGFQSSGSTILDRFAGMGGRHMPKC